MTNLEETTAREAAKLRRGDFVPLVGWFRYGERVYNSRVAAGVTNGLGDSTPREEALWYYNFFLYWGSIATTAYCLS